MWIQISKFKILSVYTMRYMGFIFVWLLISPFSSQAELSDSLRQQIARTNTPALKIQLIRRLVIAFQIAEQPDSVAQYMKQYKELAIASGNSLYINQFHYLEGAIAYNLGDIKRAKKLLLHTENLSRISKDDVTLAYALTLHAFLYIQGNQMNAGKKMNKESLDIAYRLGDSLLMSFGENTANVYYLRRNLYDEQLRHIEQAIDYFPDYALDSILLGGMKGSKYKVMMQVNKAVAYLHLPGKQDLAIRLLLQLHEQTKQQIWSTNKSSSFAAILTKIPQTTYAIS